MLSVARERPVDATTLAVLTLVDRIARDLALDYFLTGAMAQEILLYGVFGLDTGRATLDVDLAAALDTWQHFDRVKARLVQTGAFTQAREPHRLLYRAGTGQKGYPLDLLPFGCVFRSS